MKKLFLLFFILVSIASLAQSVRRKDVSELPYIFADDYGVSKDFNTTTGSISSGSNSLTVASATGYVAGQYVYVLGAHFGGITNNNISRITSISGTTITTQDNAGATVTSVTVGHDDTRPIQAAINAAKTAKGATVFLRNGRYPLRDTVVNLGAGGAWINAQLYIPNSSTSDSAINITIQGETEPNWEHSILVDWPIANKGVILESTLLPTESGRVSLLATEYGSTAFGNWNMTDVTLRNLTLRCRSKGVNGSDTANRMTGINFETQSICTIENVRVDISSKLVNSTFQGFQSSYGIYLPARGNAAWVSLKNVFVGGFDDGIQFNEHTDGDNITVAACFRGLRSGDMDHSFHFGRVLFNGCATNYLVEGNSYGDIDNFATEHFVDTAGFGSKWYATQEDILQTAGTPKISIKYHIVTSAVGEDNAHWYLHSTGGTSTGIVANPMDATGSYSLPTASTTTLGGVKVDGTTITISSGVISSSGGGGTPAGSNTQIQYNNSGAFGASSNFTWNAGTLKNYSPSGGAVVELKHPSAVYPWQLIQGYSDADDYAIVRNGVIISRWTSAGAHYVPALGDGSTTRMTTVDGAGLFGAQIIPVASTTNQNIAYGNGSGQVTAGDNNFQWDGSRLKLYSGSLGSTIEMRHASNTNSWKIIQGFSVVDDWVVTHGASDTKMFQINSSGVVNIPNLGTSSRLIAVNTSSDLVATSIDPANIQTTSNSVKTLSSQYTDVSNSGTTETDLMSYTLPANQLVNDGDRVVIDAHFTTAVNSNNKTLNFYYGAYSQTYSPSTIASGTDIHVRVTIIRTSSGNERITREFVTGFTSLPGYASSTISTSSTAIIKFTGTSNTASSDITQRTMTVTYYPN